MNAFSKTYSNWISRCHCPAKNLLIGHLPRRNKLLSYQSCFPCLLSHQTGTGIATFSFDFACSSRLHIHPHRPVPGISSVASLWTKTNIVDSQARRHYSLLLSSARQAFLRFQVLTASSRSGNSLSMDKSSSKSSPKKGKVSDGDDKKKSKPSDGDDKKKSKASDGDDKNRSKASDGDDKNRSKASDGDDKKKSKASDGDKKGGSDDKLNPKHVTRSQLSHKEEKDKYLNMPIEEKRTFYKCKDKFKTLDDILTWPDYAEENEIQPVRKSKVLFPYDAEINQKVSIWRGDITQLEIDAIANAANSSLLGGGGVDGAIHSAAGSYLRQENSTLDGCDCGDAKISGGYKLPAKYVISTVGPMGQHEDKLKSCYKRCLEVMMKNKLRSLALPCISTGVYGYPNEDAAVVAMGTVRKFLQKNKDKVDRLIFCLFLEKDVNIYNDLMPQYFPLEGEKETDTAEKSDDGKDAKL